MCHPFSDPQLPLLDLLLQDEFGGLTGRVGLGILGFSSVPPTPGRAPGRAAVGVPAVGHPDVTPTAVHRRQAERPLRWESSHVLRSETPGVRHPPRTEVPGIVGPGTEGVGDTTQWSRAWDTDYDTPGSLTLDNRCHR